LIFNKGTKNTQWKNDRHVNKSGKLDNHMQKTEVKPIKNKEIASGYRAEQRFCYMSSKT
jgi:hypothetical protein